MKKKMSSLAVAGFVVSLVALVTFFIPALDIIAALTAFGLSLPGLISAIRGRRGKGLAIAGLAISVLALILSVSYLSSLDSADKKDTLEQTATVTVQPTGTPVLTETAEDFKASCEKIGYKELCRYPDEHRGDRIVLTVKVSQILDTGAFSTGTAWSAYDDESGYGWYNSNQYYLIDSRDDDDMRILEDDVITVYGTFSGIEEVVTVLGVKNRLPRIIVEYLELIDE